MDVQNAFVVTVTIYSALAILSLLKSFHHEARPFFVTDLTPTKCWIEYGNPSGHSVTSTALYLTMWNLLCRRYRPTTYWRVVSLLMTIVVILCIATSRLYNGVHTYNQILLGWILGVAIYYLYCHALYKEICMFVRNTHRKQWITLAFNKGTIVFYSCYALACFNMFYGNTLHPVPQEWLANIKKNCPNANEMDLDAEKDNFKRFNVALSIIGSYIGLILEQRYIGTRKYKHFYQTSWYITLARLIICTLVGSPTLFGMFLFPKKGYNWLITLFMRMIIPMTLGNCYLFAMSKYVGKAFCTINTSIVDHTESEEDLDIHVNDILRQKQE